MAKSPAPKAAPAAPAKAAPAAPVVYPQTASVTVPVLPVRGNPPSPRRLVVSLDAPRRQALHQVLAGLADQHATIRKSVGAQVVQVQVQTPLDALYYLLDNLA